MRHHSESSEHTILECKCGEEMVLPGLEEDWYSRRPVFRCACGERLIFTDRGDEEGFGSAGLPRLRALNRRRKYL